ncbi:MAG: hypothetical protein J5674_00475 [Candidatus Methanomethylophilaceae archaeon]|nr:hypothetical protein [Candidatus Methanomethylophilaceae archaeon]
MTRIQYTGSNYDELKSLLGDKLLAPYFCMGFTMLSVLTDDGFISVQEGDYVEVDDNGNVIGVS